MIDSDIVSFDGSGDDDDGMEGMPEEEERMEETENASKNKAGALLSLGPEAWLSATAIELLMDVVRPSDCAFIINSFPSTAKLEAKLQKIHKIMSHNWLLIHDRKHWLLIISNIQDSTVDVYNALSSNEENVSRVLTTIKRLPAAKGTWTERRHPEYRQSNSFDCGVFVLVAALCSVAQLPLPLVVDGVHWRKILTCLIHPDAAVTTPHQTDDQGSQNDQEEKDPTAIPDFHLDFETQQRALDIRLQELTATRNQVSSARTRFQIVNKASNIVRRQHAALDEQLKEECKDLEAQQADYDRIAAEVSTSNIRVGLDRLQEGLREGKEEVTSKLDNLRARQVAAEGATQAWDAALRLCSTTCDMADQRAREASTRLQESIEVGEVMREKQRTSLANMDHLLAVAHDAMGC
ncbi:MAG: hypothetical protein Q9171_003871 [Xanthocarpia ochracea]